MSNDHWMAGYNAGLRANPYTPVRPPEGLTDRQRTAWLNGYDCAFNDRLS